ncbi:MAG: hypothetical protein IJY89_05745 [Clostridia bacterium]|nr:hypothetical protein [Clostridia bacterium]
MTDAPVFLNFHGFMGAPDNKNGRALAFLYPDALILSPRIDYLKESPRKILEGAGWLIDEHQRAGQPFILVGQSLGGFVAEALSRRYDLPCLLTNPCLDPHLCKVIVDSPVPRAFLEEYKALGCAKGMKSPHAYILCSKGDELLGEENFARCQELGGWLKEVRGGHSSIEELKKELNRGIEEILQDFQTA